MAAAIVNHYLAGQAQTGTTAVPQAAAAATPGASSGTSSSSANSATISANDFLTLLVTEMKNQDPTATTDPNEYINQLVNVNSLQQLIAINQTLTTAYPSTTADSVTGASGASTASPTSASASAQAQPATATSASGAISSAAANLAPGNLGVPAANSAAQSVAQALGGRPRVQ
ncbi:MAG: flagellar hook capping FlgD N-terminal domain-containing protein [Terracidiphilus sp.]